MAALKSHAFRVLSNSKLLDEKVHWIQKWLGMSFSKVAYLLYPRVYCITDLPLIVGKQRSFGTADCDIDWGFFTDDTESSIVRPKI